MEAVGQLAGGIAHDFNNVLTVIGGNLRLLQRDIEHEDASEILTEALTAVKRASELTHGLLAIARKDALDVTEVDVKEVMAETQHLLQRTFPANVRVLVEEVPEPLFAFADAGYLQTAIINVGLNARDAMPGGGTLVMRAVEVRVPSVDRDTIVEPGHYVVISLTDDGIGMSTDVLALASEPLFTTKSDGKGTGLGLTMVKGFVEDCGGALTIDSQLGRGTTISLYLPSVPELELSRSVAEVVPDFYGKGRILVADDDEQVRVWVNRCLTRFGFEVFDVEDGHQALLWVESNGLPDLVLSDVQMPVVDGIELANALRARQPGIPLVIMSASREALRMHDAGLAPVLEKPFSESALIEKIQQAFINQ